jgi:hypothetical protein
MTDFSTREAAAIAEVFIPWTGAECAVLRAISKMAIAANEAIIHRPLGMTICFSIGHASIANKWCEPSGGSSLAFRASSS